MNSRHSTAHSFAITTLLDMKDYSGLIPAD
jgi:hypothetical protein